MFAKQSYWYTLHGLHVYKAILLVQLRGLLFKLKAILLVQMAWAFVQTRAFQLSREGFSMGAC